LVIIKLIRGDNSYRIISVLPKFSITIQTEPEIILPTTQYVRINASARSVVCLLQKCMIFTYYWLYR